MPVPRALVLAGCVLLLCGSSQAGSAVEEFPRTSTFRATYDMTLAGFSLGDFHLTADFDGPQYKLRAKAKFALLAGLLYRGGGTTQSAGTLTATGPDPSIFEVSYKGGDKKEKRRITFADGAVSEVSILPKKRPNPRQIPLTKAELEHVLDPLSGAFLSGRSDLPPGDINICHKTLEVFDGEQRFDIILTPKRIDKPLEGAPPALADTVAVCRVKFVPIGGYRPDNAGIKFMTATNDVEAWLVTVPGTRLYLPYRIVVPTPLGPGSATLTEIKTEPPH
jgi:Protein of unknown function (DUF3108)